MMNITELNAVFHEHWVLYENYIFLLSGEFYLDIINSYCIVDYSKYMPKRVFQYIFKTNQFYQI